MTIRGWEPNQKQAKTESISVCEKEKIKKVEK